MLDSVNGFLRRIRGHFFKYDINVIDNYLSLDDVLKKNLSVIRLGDGEFDIMAGKNIPYQVYAKTLDMKLREIVLGGSLHNIMVCLPDVFEKLNRYNKSCRNFYYECFFYQNRKLLTEIESKNNMYGSTFLSRPYIDLKDKSGVSNYFDKLKSLWNGKDILIVEGKYTRSGEGNDLFKNARSIKRVIAPSHDAFSKYQVIKESILNNAGDRLILLMLGPTSKVLVYDLKINYRINNQILDIGHIDSEYEWFKMGAKKKVKIPHKHTAEFNYYDKNVVILNDKNYENQIVDRINISPKPFKKW
ncbi:SP_1767 family glycosyltransferase [Lentilactobacillus hilgardii]|uniref:SP_1767 family glycosyltransferase n=1 Tax=Lentilactobacillus hilgardii TaxID=1588 RepID=UPI0021A87641|nr:SP_1767 family glycosyltransferase [Lentilactobacillus hilgardii]MCT3395874.1 SP_1767 family glycosyltransferase [Lentilactobacillus hilgardii]